MVRLRWGVLPMLVLGACAYPDYTAVRDWAGTAAVAAAWPPAAALPGAEAPAAAATRQAGVRAMQGALDTWFTALATLAEDGLVRRPEDPLREAAVQATALDPEAGRAVAALGGLLVEATKGNWRAPQTADAIRAAVPAVQILLRSLSAAVAASAAADAPAREAVAALYGPLEAEARDPAARQAIRDWRAQREAEIAARAAAREAYRAVLSRIAEGQALLLERAGRLSQEETARQVRAQEAALRRAATLLPWGVAAGG